MAVIGVDLGGTRMRAAVVDGRGEVLAFDQRPAGASRPKDEIVSDLADLILGVEKAAGLRGLPVGLGVPTTVRDHGLLAPCPNLPTLGELALADVLWPHLGRVVRLDNDARCFARGEARWGAGQGYTTVVAVTLGTSIGMATVMGGQVLDGTAHEAGEIWRSPIRLDEPSPTLHDVLSGEGIAAAYGEAGGSAKTVAERARAGDGRAQAVLTRYGRVLGGALAWVCDVLDPELVVVGGSVSLSWDLISPPVLEALAGRKLAVRVSVLGDRAAVLGAAALVDNGGSK